MGNLTFHGDKEQYEEIQQQYRPKHGDIEYFKESHDKGHGNGTYARVPKLKLR